MEKTVFSKFNSDDGKYYQVQGYLKAFEQFNIYTNHGQRFFFRHLFYEGTIESTLLKFFEDESKIFNEVFDAENYHFIFNYVKEHDWEETLIKELYEQFLGVLDIEYKVAAESAAYHRSHCINTFINMLKDFFKEEQLEVWSSGVGIGNGVCGCYFCESSVDFVFKIQDDIYLLYFGTYD